MIYDPKQRPTVCVICPCHNEELLLESFHERLKQVLLTLSGYDHRIHFVDDEHGYAAGEAGVVLKTTNGGEVWTEIMSDQSYEFSSLFFVTEDKGWVVGQYLGLPHVPVIFYTDDGGGTWNEQTFEEDDAFSDIVFTDENHGWVTGGTSSTAVCCRRTDSLRKESVLPSSVVWPRQARLQPSSGRSTTTWNDILGSI